MGILLLSTEHILLFQLRTEKTSNMIKLQMVPSFLLVAMGLVDCLTTVIGISLSHASELNPFMAGVVSTNIGAFIALKIATSLIIASTYLIAHKILTSTSNKTSLGFKLSSVILKIVYGGIIAFFCVVVINNLVVLLA